MLLIWCPSQMGGLRSYFTSTTGYVECGFFGCDPLPIYYPVMSSGALWHIVHSTLCIHLCHDQAACVSRVLDGFTHSHQQWNRSIQAK